MFDIPDVMPTDGNGVPFYSLNCCSSLTSTLNAMAHRCFYRSEGPATFPHLLALTGVNIFGLDILK
jgi:hypothetical protein